MGTKSKWLKGKLTFYNNAVVDESVGIYTTTNASVPPYGLRVLEPTTSAKMRLSGGPAVGQEVQIVCLTTYTTVIRVSTMDSTNGGATVVAPGSCEVYAVGLKAGSPAAGGFPGCVTLRGVTTATWAVVGNANSSTVGGTTGGGQYLSTSFA